MIFEFQSQENFQVVEGVFNLIYLKKIGIFWWFLSYITVLTYTIYKLNKQETRVDKILSLLLPSLIYCGTFIYTYGIVDEVAINLEHAYNLYHFGKFSMSPDQMIDGTIEVLYYLLHTPFGQSYSSLVFGNFLISLIVGWLHLFILWNYKFTKSYLKNLVLLSCFSLSFPIISIFSNGFGNGLLSLVFLISIYLCLQGKLKYSLLISGLLPLIRPDGILWSVVNILTILILVRRELKKILLSQKHYNYLFLIFLPFISITLYLLAYKFFYGYFLPTPILFKSVKLSMLPMFSSNSFIGNLLLFAWTPLHGLALICLGLIIYLRIKHPSLLREDKVVRTLSTYSLFTSSIFLFYNITKVVTRDFTGNTYARYWIGFEISLIFLLLVISSRIKISIKNVSVRSIHFFPLFLLSILFLTPAPLRTNEELSWLNRYDSRFSGVLTEEIVPQDLSISASEMNIFGLMINRHVIDLWGYTTREIATSKVCNAAKIRNNENFFLDTLPDVYWVFWFTRNSDQNNFNNVEDSLLTSAYTSKEWNLLGDLPTVLSKYDFFIVKNTNGQVAYLVRKQVSNRLISHLKEKDFKLIRSREMDMKSVNAKYKTQIKVQYNCS